MERSPLATRAAGSCCLLRHVLNWRKGFWWRSIATNKPLLQEGKGLALEMCGEAPWGLSRQACRRWQPLWALSPKFLHIVPQATSAWTVATACCWATGGGPGRCPLPLGACRPLTLQLGPHAGHFLETQVDRAVAAFLLRPYILSTQI